MSTSAMMDELPQPGQQPQQQNSKEEAAGCSGEIGAMDVDVDVEQLPQALRELVTQLREVPPTIQKVDLGGPDQGGDYFRTDPGAADLEDGAAGLRCSSVRLWVLGLIGTCPSVRDLNLSKCGISSESEVERLCQGLKSNAVLQWLTLDGNVGFGSEFGCLQVGHILASSASGTSSLEELDMVGLGLKAAGLSHLLSTLLANTARGSLSILNVEHNPECLADERAAQLLAQLVSSKGLRKLGIRETGLAVAGAALLSTALGAKGLETLQVGGGPEPILNVIVSSLGRCSELSLLLSKEEEEASQLAEPLAQMLRTNTSLTFFALEGAHFSTQAWNGIFQALGAANSRLSNLFLGGSTTLDHSVMDDVHQLLARNPGLAIGAIINAPLKGTGRNLRGFFNCTCSWCRDNMGECRNLRGFFYCTCSSCRDNMGECSGAQILNVEQLPKELRPLTAALTAVPPLIEEVDLNGPDHAAVGYMLRLNPEHPSVGSSMLWELRLLVLGLIGRCPSLKRVMLNDCFISKESVVERLCQGLKSNTVLEHLKVDKNSGFGSEFGCLQMSHILASSSTTLETLEIGGVGLKAAGLSQLLSTLLANTGASCLQTLDVENNPECLADERAVELLVQVVLRNKCLRELRIRNTGLAVAGAALLSTALGAHMHDEEENAGLHKLWVGGPAEPILNAIVSSLGRCSKIVLSFANEEEAGQLAETLAQMLRTNTSLETLWLEKAHFSTEAWGCIFRALGAANSTLSDVSLIGSTTLDHSVVDDLYQLLAGNPGLRMAEISDAPLKGNRRYRKSTGFFYCTCTSCSDSMHTVLTELGEGGQTLNVEHLPKELRPLVAALTAVPPSIEEVDLRGPDYAAVANMFRVNPEHPLVGSSMLWELRLLVLGLIGRCPSLKRVMLNDCFISKESEVERLCQGLASNTVLQHLLVDNNLGFGSDFGCQQVSNILASSSTSQLETLDMWQVGMKGTGLCLLLGTLLANGQSQLELLCVGGNPECLANDDEQGSASAVELLAQLLTGHTGHTGTACRLRELRIDGTGLSVVGATRLSAALAQNTSLRKLKIGGDPILKTILMSSSPINIPMNLVLVCPKEEAGVAEALAEMLRTNTTLRGLWLVDAHFSTDGWHCIFEALGANIGTGLSYLGVEGSTTLDHRVIDDLHQLFSVRPYLVIPDIQGAPLRGNRFLLESRGNFICYCSSCTASTGGTLELKRFIDELSAPAGASRVARITRQDWMDKLSPICMPRSQRSEELIAMRRRVLSLVGSCASLKSIQLPYSDVIEEEDCEDVEALCSGLAFNLVLEELTLDGNRGFGCNFGCAQLATVVSGCSATLRKISLQDVGMKSSGLRHLIQALSATRLGGSTCITEMALSISYNEELGDAGAHLVAQLLSGPTTSAASSLTTLNIVNIGMGVSGATSLSLALQHYTNLRALMVGEPELDGPTALLLQGLINNLTLTHLRLWKRGSKPDKGLADILAQLLQQSTTALGVLEIENVPFQPAEWRKIFRALESNQVLKVLNILDTYCLEPVFNDLLQLLQVNTTIEEIEGLEITDLKDKGKIPLLQEALRRNKQQREYVNVLKEKLPLAQPSTGRLFLCGPPYAGKSTLSETMVRCHQQPQAGCIGGLGAFMLGQWGFRLLRPRTEGIEIQVLRNDADMQISVWDMAGQEQYHALHDCIFPTTMQACIFVFVYNPYQNMGRRARSNGNAVVLTKKDSKDFYEKLLYWLRFIASNSLGQGHVLPKICIVITNLDRLQPKYSQDHVLKWATPVVDELRRRFEGVLQVSECISVVKAYSTMSVQPVVGHLFKEFEELLKKQVSPVFQACGEMSLALARLTMHPNAQVAPMVRLADFYKMCSNEVDALRDLFHDGPTIGGIAVEQYITKARAAVAAYLHDVGSIVYFEGLDFVVVNPNWLNNVFLSKFIQSEARAHNARLLPDEDDGLIEESELHRILACFLEKSQPPCPGFGPDDLLQLLLRLEFCYKKDTNPFIPGMVSYFVPSSLAHQKHVDASQAAKKSTMFSCFSDPNHQDPSNSTRQGVVLDLEWKVSLEGVEQCIGTRLQCDAKETKFLTAGFFPRLQVCLGKALVQVDNKYDFIRARTHGCEILVESSGEDNATFVDILARSTNSKNEIWVVVQKYIVEKIQAFCATPKGCPGVTLIQCIIRPQCVAALTPRMERQVVPVETLKNDLINDILSKSESTDFTATQMVEDASSIGYQHTWPKHSAGYTNAVELLDARALRDVSQKVMVAFSEKTNSLVEVESQISQAVNDVITSSSQGQSVESQSSMVPSKSIQKQPTMERKLDRLYEEMKKRFDGVEKRLDEQKELLSNIVPSLIMELKLQQQKTQETLLNGVNKVMSFMRDSQNTKLPRFPYLAKGGVGIGQRFVAFLTLAKASKLHFMCEDRNRMHYVENQPGCDLTINKPGHETLRFVILCSFKILYILMKAGFQVGAGLGGIFPDHRSLEGVVVPISSRVVADLLDDMKLKDPQFSAQSEVDELARLHYFLKSTGNDDITKHFELHRVEYLRPDATGKLPTFGWVCRKCYERGKTNNSLRDSPP